MKKAPKEARGTMSDTEAALAKLAMLEERIASLESRLSTIEDAIADEAGDDLISELRAAG